MSSVSRAPGDPLGSFSKMEASVAVENTILRGQLANMMEGASRHKREIIRLTAERDELIAECHALQAQLDGLQATAHEGAEAADKIALLEAELERQGVVTEEARGARAAAEVECAQVKEQLAVKQTECSDAVEALHVVDEALRGVISRAAEVTGHLLPSYREMAGMVGIKLESESSSTSSSALSPVQRASQRVRAAVPQLHDALHFLAEVVRAKADAVAMVQQRMKDEVLELKSAVEVERDGKRKMQGEVQKAEERMSQLIHEHDARLREVAAMHNKQLREVQEAGTAAEKVILEMRKKLTEMESRAEKLVGCIKQQDIQLEESATLRKKEASARAHLEAQLDTERKARLIAEKHLETLKAALKMQVVTLGSGSGQMSEREVAAMLDRLTAAKGALEVENLRLRDELAQYQAAVSLPARPPPRRPPPSSSNSSSPTSSPARPHAAPSTPEVQGQVEAVVREGLADDGLAEALLLRNILKKGRRQ
eukprot:Sspe_Gene.82727::Locus_54224_Transcript_1_2_Confidence_0.600_Length_1714::g.82727::m.82727